MKPLILHAHSTGPNPYKIAIALEILKTPYDLKLWEFGDGPNGVKGPAYLNINENGRVPALEDPNTGVVSWESGACMNYLLRVYDKDNQLGPQADTEQARVDFDKWNYFLLTTLAPMTGQCNWFRHYHPRKNEDAYDRYAEQTYRCYSVLEAQLKKSAGKFILGDALTAVDLHFYPWIWEWEFAGLSLKDYPAIQKWFETVATLKEVIDVYKKIPEAEGK